jgi:hypothetical protein
VVVKDVTCKVRIVLFWKRTPITREKVGVWSELPMPLALVPFERSKVLLVLLLDAGWQKKRCTQFL